MATDAEPDAANVDKLEKDIQALQIEQEKQADTVRALKAEKMG